MKDFDVEPKRRFCFIFLCLHPVSVGGWSHRWVHSLQAVFRCAGSLDFPFCKMSNFELRVLNCWLQSCPHSGADRVAACKMHALANPYANTEDYTRMSNPWSCVSPNLYPLDPRRRTFSARGFSVVSLTNIDRVTLWGFENRRLRKVLATNCEKSKI